jgi:hypothetical protein
MHLPTGRLSLRNAVSRSDIAVRRRPLRGKLKRRAIVFPRPASDGRAIFYEFTSATPRH